MEPGQAAASESSTAGQDEASDRAEAAEQSNNGVPETAAEIAPEPAGAAVAIAPSAAFGPGMRFAGVLGDVDPVDPIAVADAAGPPRVSWPVAPRWSHEDAAARWNAVVAEAEARAGWSTPNVVQAVSTAAGMSMLETAVEPDVAIEAPSSAAGIPAPARGDPWPDPPQAVGSRSRRGPTIWLPEELHGRLLAVASAAVGVGLLLPWGPVVIGAPDLGSPWRGLGIVATWNWVLFLVALGATALSLRPSARVAGWVRLGAVPLTFGALVLGVAWPYLFGSIGGGIGVTIVAFGAVASVVLGLLGLRLGRHPEPSSPV